VKQKQRNKERRRCEGKQLLVFEDIRYFENGKIVFFSF